MKIGLFSPYVPKHFGGGEKHFLTSAWYLSQQHQVEVHIPHGVKDLSDRIKKYESMFELDLSRVKFVASELGDRRSSLWQTWKLTAQYDAFLYLTDGSLFLSGAKRNILHIQVPFTFAKNSPLERIKLRNWSIKNANSEFTRQVIQKSWKTTVQYLHYPYVRQPESITQVKRKQIVAVGRFVAASHNTQTKGQELLIEALRLGREQFGWKNVSLYLAGSIEPGKEHEMFVRELQEQAQGLPVTFGFDLSHQKLAKLYQESLIFWHAAGYQVDVEKHPEKVEHFGMTTIEAMSYGCLPFVVPKGGGKEIITDQKNGFYFTDAQDLAKKTERIFLSSEPQRRQWQDAARTRSQDFSLERFCRTLDKMIGVT